MEKVYCVPETFEAFRVCFVSTRNFSGYLRNFGIGRSGAENHTTGSFYLDNLYMHYYFVYTE